MVAKVVMYTVGDPQEGPQEKTLYALVLVSPTRRPDCGAARPQRGKKARCRRGRQRWGKVVSTHTQATRGRRARASHRKALVERANKVPEEPKVMGRVDKEECPPAIQQKDCAKGKPKQVQPWYERLPC